MPARPNAAGSSVAADLPSGRKAFPSRINSASNLPGPPTHKNASHSRFVGAEQVCERLHGRSGRDDRADVQVAIWPAVQPVSDVPRRNRVCREGLIDCRMAQRASNAHGCKLAVLSKDALHSQRRRPVSATPTWLQGRRDSQHPAAQHSPDPAAMRRHLLSVRVESAARGVNPGPLPPFAAPAIVSCSRSAPPQNASLPKVSKRKILRPSRTTAAA